MIELKRILCPVDFSEFSRHALQHAVVLAHWNGSEITVLHAYTVPRPPVLFSGVPVPPPLEPPLQRLHDQVMSELTRFTEAAKAAGVALRLEASTSGPAHSILEAATSLPADLIVMGAHGRGGLDRFVMGSVTEKVLRKAACPVLTVPPPVSDAPAQLPVLFERILCPVDFSDASMKALTYALSLAQEANAQLIVCMSSKDWPSATRRCPSGSTCPRTNRLSPMMRVTACRRPSPRKLARGANGRRLSVREKLIEKSCGWRGTAKHI